MALSCDQHLEQEVKDTTLKGLVHLGLAALATYEAARSTTRARKVLNGAAAGWHLHATVYHLLYEPKENKSWHDQQD
jgi:hypothetical protein